MSFETFGTNKHINAQRIHGVFGHTIICNEKMHLRKMPNLTTKMANANYHPKEIYHAFFKQHFRNNTIHRNVDWRPNPTL